MSKRNKVDGVRTMYDDFLPGANRQQNMHVYRTQLIQRMYVRLLVEMATGRFKWEGVPEYIDQRFIEMELFRSALVVFHLHKPTGKFIVSKATPEGTPNIYDNPTSFRVYGNGTTYLNTSVRRKYAVPIWANHLRQPDSDIVQVYAHKLANLERTIEINVNNARQPKLLTGTQNQKLSLLNIARQYDEGAPVIQVSNQFNAGEMLQTLDLSVHPDTVEKLDILQTRIWSRCMGLLGIDNANQDKKERLVASEVDANAQQVHAIKRMNLNERERACDRINKKFSLNIGVSYWVDEEPQSVAGPDIPMNNNVGN